MKWLVPSFTKDNIKKQNYIVCAYSHKDTEEEDSIQQLINDTHKNKEQNYNF